MARFEVGDHARDFSATTYDGNKIRLTDFLGKRALVLFFYPKDGTPICTQEACAFRDSYEQFIDAGADVIGVSGEAIFHPIPSIQNREGVANCRVLGAWDVARTAVYLGLSGGGLLGRAVHCNCGRPALWAFLPVD